MDVGACFEVILGCFCPFLGVLTVKYYIRCKFFNIYFKNLKIRFFYCCNCIRFVL